MSGDSASCFSAGSLLGPLGGAFSGRSPPSGAGGDGDGSEGQSRMGLGLSDRPLHLIDSQPHYNMPPQPQPQPQQAQQQAQQQQQQQQQPAGDPESLAGLQRQPAAVMAQRADSPTHVPRSAEALHASTAETTLTTASTAVPSANMPATNGILPGTEESFTAVATPLPPSSPLAPNGEPLANEPAAVCMPLASGCATADQGSMRCGIPTAPSTEPVATVTAAGAAAGAASSLALAAEAVQGAAVAAQKHAEEEASVCMRPKQSENGCQHSGQQSVSRPSSPREGEILSAAAAAAEPSPAAAPALTAVPAPSLRHGRRSATQLRSQERPGAVGAASRQSQYMQAQSQAPPWK